LYFRAPSDKDRNLWVQVLCRAKDKTLLEREALIKKLKAEGDQCLACQLAFAEEQAAIDEANEAVEVGEGGEGGAANSNNNATSAEVKEEESTEQVLAELLGLPVADIDGNQLKLGDIFKENDTVVVALLRHFG